VGDDLLGRARKLRPVRKKSVYEVQCNCGWKASVFLSIDHARRWGAFHVQTNPGHVVGSVKKMGRTVSAFAW
jgi:hypothetical protein